MSENISKGKNKYQKFILVFLGGALGILLLLFGSGFDGGRESSTELEQPTSQDAASYAAMLEERVSKICSDVSGTGKVSVFVSLKGGYRTVYAFDSQSSSSGYKSELVMSGSGSDKKAVITAYDNPEIAGVGIVCEGASDPQVKAQIISLVAATLDISTNKIFVASAN